MNTKNYQFILFAVVILIIASITTVWYVINHPRVSDLRTVAQPPLAANQTSEPAPVFYSQLDGTPVSSANEIVPTILGIMIDNHPEARPQAGLSLARIVYEVPVEGSFTRYFALFSSTDRFDKVGPVRSSRPYFLSWLDEYGISYYWHVGGSPEAQNLLKKYGARNADLYYLPATYYWRTAGNAPHNVYINDKNWQLYLDRHKLPSTTWQGHVPGGTWRGWQFTPILSGVSSTEAAGIKVNYNKTYSVGWDFDSANGNYQRTINGQISKDDSGVAITADTILVQEVYKEVVDDEGRLSVNTIGSGKARVLRDGQMIRGTWKKTIPTDRTRFYDAEGNEIPLKAGKIWVEVVPQNTSIEVSI